jgi:hypothetical protein
VLENKWWTASHYLVVDPDPFVDRRLNVLLSQLSLSLYERWLAKSTAARFLMSTMSGA